MENPLRAVLRVVCTDRPGLVAELSGLLYRLGVNVLHADEHIDVEANTFFQRLEFTVPEAVAASSGRVEFEASVRRSCDEWRMRWSLRFMDDERRVAILVSKQGHCALDLLQRQRAGELSCEIPLVVSNHQTLQHEVTCRGYRFVHLPIVDEDRTAQEAQVARLLGDERIDLVVLARYMQILSPRLVDGWPERIINIHHSFLPAFAGAEPYRQAYNRGVKLIGATSHYVTRELDEGPIIAQAVERVSHRDAVGDLVRKGRDLERVVLAHAVRCHLEDRIITHGNKTLVFD